MSGKKVNNRIVVVTEYFYPRDRPDSYFLTEIAKVLSKVAEGNIKVICNSELKDNEELGFVKNKIVRLQENSLNKNGLLSRIIKFIISTLKLGWKTLFTIRTDDRLFSVTNPAFLIILLAVLKKFKRFHYTLLVYDIFPENLIAVNLLKQDSYIYKITKKIFDWSYSQADHLIVIGRDMEELMTEKTKATVELSLITNWCDIDTVVKKPKKDNPILTKHDLEDKIVFAFVGNFGRVQGIDTLLEMASSVQDERFRLLFIGDGAMLPMIKEHITKNPDGNVVYAGSFPPSEQNVFLNACDVAIVSLTDSMYGLGVPSKSYYNMAAQKPIFYLGDERSEIGQVVIENDIGWVVGHTTAHGLSQKIDSILEEKIDFKELGRKARRVVETKFSKYVVLNRYEDLFNAQR